MFFAVLIQCEESYSGLILHVQSIHIHLFEQTF